MYAVAHNVTDRPVVIDDEGRVLGGGEWGALDTTDETAKAALEAGYVVTPTVAGGVARDVELAVELVDQLEERRAQVATFDLRQLRVLARANGLDADDTPAEPIDELGKVALRRRLVRRVDVDLDVDLDVDELEPPPPAPPAPEVPAPAKAAAKKATARPSGAAQ